MVQMINSDRLLRYLVAFLGRKMYMKMTVHNKSNKKENEMILQRLIYLYRETQYYALFFTHYLFFFSFRIFSITFYLFSHGKLTVLLTTGFSSFQRAQDICNENK